MSMGRPPAERVDRRDALDHQSCALLNSRATPVLDRRIRRPRGAPDLEYGTPSPSEPVGSRPADSRLLLLAGLGVAYVSVPSGPKDGGQTTASSPLSQNRPLVPQKRPSRAPLSRSTWEDHVLLPRPGQRATAPRSAAADECRPPRTGRHVVGSVA